MSQFRHRFRVTLDGVSHDVVTNARDMAAADVGEADDGNAMLSTFRLLHACMVRLGIAGVPSYLDAFIDVLDDIDDIDGVPVGVPAEDSALPDPIRAVG